MPCYKAVIPTGYFDFLNRRFKTGSALLQSGYPYGIHICLSRRDNRSVAQIRGINTLPR